MLSIEINMPIEKLSQSVLGEADVKEFIESRKIVPEDFYILEELAKISKQLLIMDFHNFFSMNREKSKDELARLLIHVESRTDDPLSEQRKAIYNLFLKFLDKYNWAVAWNLERVFERRK